MKTGIGVLLAILTLMGCKTSLSAAQATAQEVPLTLLFASAQCGTSGQGVSADWFDKPDSFPHMPNVQSKRPIQWDPATEGAVWISMGVRTTGGYSIELVEHTAKVNEGIATIVVRMHSPAPNMMAAQVMTAPCLALKMPKDQIRQIRIQDTDGTLLAKIEL